MNGVNADSSDIFSMMDSSPGSSASGGEDYFGGSYLTMMTNLLGAPSPGMGTTAKSTGGALCKVQSQSSPLAAKSPVMSPSAPTTTTTTTGTSKNGGGGGGGGGGSGISDESRQKTDLFLSQFQAQMSQMKSAMDELLMKSGSSPSTGQGSPGSSHSPSNSTSSPRARSRGGGGGRKSGGTAAAPVPGSCAAGQPTGAVTYQSQISATNGLKLKIKKSPKLYKKRGPKGPRKGRRKRKQDDDDDDLDDGLSDEFEDTPPPRPSKMAKSSGDNGGDPGGNSVGWGDKLPEEVLERILTHAESDTGSIPLLVRASRVSRLWRKVASDPKMWLDVDLSSPRVKQVYRTERNLLYFLEHRFSHAKHLNLDGWSSAMTNAAVEVLVRCCKDLESLGVSGCQKLTGPHLKRITESCGCLKKLDLSAISTTYNTRSAVAPAALIDAAEVIGARMTHLSLANNCIANCPQILAALSEHCPNLEVLDLSNVTSPRRDTIQLNVEQLQQGCNKVRVLRWTNSDILLEQTGLKEQVASPGFPKLEELSIAVDPKKCSGMDDGCLERIVKNAKKLRLLDVRGCGKISDSGLVRVPAWDLEHLYLSGCYATKSSNDGLELIVRKWRHSFKEIDFSWTPNEDAINLAICALSEVEGDSEDQLPPVKVLDLCGSSVSLESIKKALKVCVFLTRLNLTSCRALPRGMKRNYAHIEDVLVLREQVLSGKFDDNGSND